MAFAAFDRDNLDIEAVGFLDHALACQIVLLGLERERIDLTAQPLERHCQLHGLGIDWFAVLCRINPELRRHTVLEDGYFNREVAIFQKSAVVRPFRWFAFLAMLLGGFAAAVTGCQRCDDKKRYGKPGDDCLFHGLVPLSAAASKRPVSRSISV